MTNAKPVLGPAPKNEPPSERGYVINLETIRALAPEAQRRCMTVGQLAEAIIDTVARDGMVSAVLDDEGAR